MERMTYEAVQQGIEMSAKLIEEIQIDGDNGLFEHYRALLAERIRGIKIAVFAVPSDQEPQEP